MNMFVIFGSKDYQKSPEIVYQEVPLDDCMVKCGVVKTFQIPEFDNTHPDYEELVLLKIIGFSLNYRDKGFIRKLQHFPLSRYSSIGSDFVGLVLDVGRNVRYIKPGDRVIGNSHYEGLPYLDNGARAGIPSNVASKRFQVLNSSKLLKIPDIMTNDVAAGFGINSQTAYSIIRKAGIKDDYKVLVTSAKSNTSLSCINALRKTGAKIFISTTSKEYEYKFYEMGISGIISPELLLNGDKYKNENGIFDVVIDPFYDLHIEKAVELLKPFGNYFTCGYTGKYKMNNESLNVFSKIMTIIIVKNICIHGNCLGLTSDLQQAVLDYSNGSYNHYVDSVYHAGQEAEFMNRTFNDGNRFGKVVYLYDD